MKALLVANEFLDREMEVQALRGQGRNDVALWDRLNVAFEYLQAHIAGKATNKYTLSEIDLVLVSNFKGGNASITEPKATLDNKLSVYSRQLAVIGRFLGDKSLNSLTVDELAQLKSLASDFLMLTVNDETAVRGFRSSYASALLAGYFPNVLPVLDRRVLQTAQIKYDEDSQGQAKRIYLHYPELIGKCYEALRASPGTTLRELDKKLFGSDRPSVN